jgi:hypothetical protein
MKNTLVPRLFPKNNLSISKKDSQSIILLKLKQDFSFNLTTSEIIFYITTNNN